MKTLALLQNLDLKNRRVFVRVDFNVPLKKDTDSTGEAHYSVADETRIVGALETIRYVVEQGGKCILASHLGRPDGKPSKKYSLEPVAQRLSEHLAKDVILTEDCVGDGPRGLSLQMRPGDVMLLENLRFHAGEEENSVEFSNRLAELADVFVTDAFGALHRAHASTSSLPKLIAHKGIGYLVQKELSFLAPLKDNPQRPFVLVMGGSKVSDKIGVLEHFLDKVDRVVIGGAMAYAFLKAQGVDVGNSLCDHKQVTLAARLLKSASARQVRIVLPDDHIVCRTLDDVGSAKVSQTEAIADGWMGVDIGPKSITKFATAFQDAETIFWNGPMGVFEIPAFAKGTFEVAKLIAGSRARKLAGGGDSVSAIKQAGLDASFDFISTGGGATLEYLEGKELPGLKALELSSRSS